MTDSFTARLRARFDHWLRTAPPTRLIVSSFLLVVALGTLLLLLPFSTKAPLKPLDALFTAVSATCVTGLVAVDTYSTFTGFGQAVVLAMIQIGGLGLVTFASFFTLSFTRRQDYRTLQLVGESVSSSGLAEARGLLSMVVRLAAGFELAGALLMLPVFVPQYGPEGIWIALFLAISAFCNAGFDILGRTVPYVSLTGYVHNWYVQAVLMFLIIAGGLGFIVWVDLMEWPKRRRLRLQSKVVLLVSAAGCVFFEWGFEKLCGKPSTISDLSAAVSGVLVGKPMDGVWQEEYEALLPQVIGDPELPVVCGLSVGHALPRCIVPLGVPARVDVQAQKIEFL